MTASPFCDDDSEGIEIQLPAMEGTVTDQESGTGQQRRNDADSDDLTVGSIFLDHAAQDGTEEITEIYTDIQSIAGNRTPGRRLALYAHALHCRIGGTVTERGNDRTEKYDELAGGASDDDKGGGEDQYRGQKDLSKTQPVRERPAQRSGQEHADGKHGKESPDLPDPRLGSERNHVTGVQ